MSDKTSLPVPRATVEQIVECRDKALALYERAYAAIATADEAIQEAHAMANKAAPFEINSYTHDRIDEISAFNQAVRLPERDQFLRTARKLTDLQCWGYVVKITELERLLKHPADSSAWGHFGLKSPPRCGGWVRADFLDGFDGWTCHIEQGAYGHAARKATWLYAHGVELPRLEWGRAPGDFVRLDEGFHSREERARAIKTGACQRLSKKQRAATPPLFRDLLISIARSALRTKEAA